MLKSKNENLTYPDNSTKSPSPSSSLQFPNSDSNKKKQNSSSQNKTKTKSVQIKQFKEEKLIICFDLSSELNITSYDNSKQSFFSLLQTCLVAFIKLKSFLNKNHSFAIVVLHSEASLLCDFTKDIDTLINKIRGLLSLQVPPNFQLDSLFKLILFLMEKSPWTPHSYRLIFLYGRSKTLPTFNDNMVWNDLKQKNNFLVDVIYLYRPEDTGSKKNMIFDLFCHLDHLGNSYMCPASSVLEVQQSFFQLLANPVHRPIQKNARFELY